MSVLLGAVEISDSTSVKIKLAVLFVEEKFLLTVSIAYVGSVGISLKPINETTIGSKDFPSTTGTILAAGVGFDNLGFL